MKIGVVSDTHSRKVPQQLLNDFKKVDVIVHAGDFCSLQDLKIFSQMKEVRAVYGNMDEFEIRRMLPKCQIFQCGEFSIGLTHGEGPAQEVFDCVRNEFKQQKVDVVIFGHSHQRLNKKIDDILYFNPGSPNDTIFAPYCSYGILELEAGKINAKIIKVKD